MACVGLQWEQLNSNKNTGEADKWSLIAQMTLSAVGDVIWGARDLNSSFCRTNKGFPALYACDRTSSVPEKTSNCGRARTAAHLCNWNVLLYKKSSTAVSKVLRNKTLRNPLFKVVGAICIAISIVIFWPLYNWLLPYLLFNGFEHDRSLEAACCNGV